MMDVSIEEKGSLLDALYLEMLHLVEEQAICRVNIEVLSNDGQLHLAKTRYVQGSQTVSVAQIPTENSMDFKAIQNVKEVEGSDILQSKRFELQTNEINKAEGYIDPLSWFGILAPSSLRTAAAQFRKCLELVIESANIQKQLIAVMSNIVYIKQNISNTT